MKSRFLALSCAAVLAVLPHTAAAQQAEDSTLVSLFLETCTRGDVNAEAIVAGIAEVEDWTEVPAPSIDFAALGQVPNQNVAAAGFRRPELVRQWQRVWNGRQVNLVVATLPAGAGNRNICAIIVPELRSAAPYLPPLREATGPLGLAPRMTDLPHYQEFAGRLRDMRRARVEIFSRSRTVPAVRNALHLYIAFD